MQGQRSIFDLAGIYRNAQEALNTRSGRLIYQDDRTGFRPMTRREESRFEDSQPRGILTGKFFERFRERHQEHMHTKEENRALSALSKAGLVPHGTSIGDLEQALEHGASNNSPGMRPQTALSQTPIRALAAGQQSALMFSDRPAADPGTDGTIPTDLGLITGTDAGLATAGTVDSGSVVVPFPFYAEKLVIDAVTAGVVLNKLKIAGLDYLQGSNNASPASRYAAGSFNNYPIRRRLEAGQVCQLILTNVSGATIKGISAALIGSGVVANQQQNY